MRMVRGFYNEQNNMVNVIHYETNCIVSLDCGKWEQGLRTNWKPQFEASLIVHYMVCHGDENSPHIHMTYISYTTNSSKGTPIQNAFAQIFKDLGYPTTLKQAVTKSGDLVW